MENTPAYDVVLIGSGLGCLVTAALLAKNGYRVQVLEKNKQIGGCLQSFGLDGKRIETAVHYMGSLSEGQTLFQLFDYLGLMEKLSLRQLDSDCFDQIILRDQVFQLAQGHEHFVDTLSEVFPHQHKALKNYIGDMKEVCFHFPLYNMRVGSMEEKRAVSGLGLKEKMKALISDPLLRDVLTANNMLYAGQYQKTPYYLHALIENSYIESSWKFGAGSSQLAKLLQDVIQQHGGEVKRNVDIVKLQVQEGRVIYAEDREGVQFAATHFVSGLHPGLTYDLLEPGIIRPVTRKRIAATPLTKSCFMLNLTLSPGQVPYRNHNIYHHQSENVWIDHEQASGKHPSAMAVFFYEDPARPGFASALSVLCTMDFSVFSPWIGTHRTTSHRVSRGEEYAACKQEIEEILQQRLFGLLPELRGSIEKVDSCSPLTYRDYLNSPEGSLYGVRKDVDDLANTTYATRTKIANLLMTGQNINLHGVLGVSITAVLTAGELMGLDQLVHQIQVHAKTRR